jgi:two-component system chemotaxis sensor kinase CheA
VRRQLKQPDFEVRGDESLLNQQIADPLLHLVRNAVDHGIETRGKVIIEIAQRDDQISITVTDDGRGIDPSLMGKIFEPGFSTAREVSELSGRGVGLDVVKTTVEELGGTVNVHSETGKGSRFEILICANPR